MSPNRNLISFYTWSYRQPNELKELYLSNAQTSYPFSRSNSVNREPINPVQLTIFLT